MSMCFSKRTFLLIFLSLISMYSHAATPMIAVGEYHTLALRSDGSLWTWGSNIYGELGLGNNTGPETCDIPSRYGGGSIPCSKTPVQIGTGFAAIGAKGSSSFAIKTDGTLWAWGKNDNGYGTSSLGDGTLSHRYSPVQIGSGFSSEQNTFTAGLAKKLDGSLWSFGEYLRELTQNSSMPTTPTMVMPNMDIARIARGYRHALILTSNGTLYSYGNNISGALGDGTLNDSVYGPHMIGSGYSFISAGTSSSFAIKNDGTLWGWGYNSNGQVGNGTTVHQSTPMLIGSGYRNVSSGGSYTAGVRSDNSLYVWGRCSGGITCNQLYTPDSPVQQGIDFTSITVGLHHAVGIKSDGSLAGWGDNLSGQLGDGTNSNRYSIGAVSNFNVLATVTSTGSSDRIFNMVESTYPQLFSPAGQVTQYYSSYPYRYYSSTASYLFEMNGHMYYVGTLTQNQPYDVGDTVALTGIAASYGF